ncbi:MAG: hypothetical protein FWC87_11200, partial [Acidimicrobiaceae bacterium]|nr:hypothetical protein [Acidimicrobiaceae bacterium]
KTRIAAEAEAQKTRLLAEASAAYNSIALSQQLIGQLPDMLATAADGLQGANLTVLSGSDGLGELVSGLAAQGLNLYETLRVATQPGGAPHGGPEANGQVGTDVAVVDPS